MPLRVRLFLMSLVLVGAALAIADAALTPLVESEITAALRADLVVRAGLMAREATVSASAPEDATGWDALAKVYARAAQCHVTLLQRDGTVIADSSGARPERGDVALSQDVADAVTSGHGWAIRRSPSASGDTLYAAASFERSDGLTGVVRLSTPLGDVDRARSEVRRLVWFGAAAALGLALALSALVSGRLTGAAAELTRAARRMSEGDLSVRTRLPGHDELATLGQALDRLASGLGATLGSLRAERDQQKRILEAMQEGVVVVDRDGRIVLVNPALRAMLLLGADAVGKLLIETVRHAQLHQLLETARGGRDDRAVEIELPGLKPRRVLVQVASLGGDEGTLFVFVDVTELRRLESLRRDFVANASHELRTPIAAVRSATETLRWGALEDRAAATRFVDIIERNAQRLQSLLEDMLELSKLESNEFKLKRERVELQRVVPIVLALFRERADKKGVHLFAELPPTLSAIEGDPRAVEHILSNLVDNAVKYCPSGTRVRVSASEEDAKVRLVVSDTGQGIAPEHVTRVFERFYRVDAGRSRELGGTGLGLSIVKHMVEAMRGRVSVESAVGQGSTFIVSLPGAAA